jgi:hypothetical protein
MKARTLTPTQVIAELEALGYELYAVLERVVHDHKVGPHPMTTVVGTRYRGSGLGRPPDYLLEAAAVHRPYVSALVCALNPPAALLWVAHVIEAYRDGTVFEIKHRRRRFTARTVAANLGALCGLRSEHQISLLTPMIEEVLSR